MYKPAAESIRVAYNGVVDWAQPNCKISQFFSVKEVTQNDRRRISLVDSPEEQAILELAREMDQIRIEWGAAIGVTSWYRPVHVNQEVGGVANSQHIWGTAIDIYTMDGSETRFEDFLDAHWGGALGYGVRSGRGFTHLDMRGGGWRRGTKAIRWNY